MTRQSAVTQVSATLRLPSRPHTRSGKLNSSSSCWMRGVVALASCVDCLLCGFPLGSCKKLFPISTLVAMPLLLWQWLAPKRTRGAFLPVIEARIAWDKIVLDMWPILAKFVHNNILCGWLPLDFQTRLGQVCALQS